MEILFILGLIWIIFCTVFFIFKMVRLYSQMHLFVHGTNEEWEAQAKEGR